VIKRGKIDMQGTYAELMQTTDFADLIHTHVISESIEEVDDDPEVLNSPVFIVDEALEEVKPVEGIHPRFDESALNPSRGQYNHYSTFRSWAGNATADRPYASIQSWGGILSSDDQHYATVRGWKDMKQFKVSNLIETASILQGASKRDHDIASIIRQNELSVYSIQDLVDIRSIQKGSLAKLSEDGVAQYGKLVASDSSTDSTAVADYTAYFRAGCGITLTLLCFALFFLVHLVRIGSGLSPFCLI
jgi:hypothetical protein